MTYTQTAFFIVIISLHVGLINSPARASDTTQSLSGHWRFIRGGPQIADHSVNLPDLKFADSIDLPGTTDTNQKGNPTGDRSTGSFTQPYAFTGTCWYQREFNLPQTWRHGRVTLLLERTKYTQVWLDDKLIGENGICCTPQEYLLGSDLASGSHKLTVAVDNQKLPPYGADSHQYSGNTQGNWNGIIGRIELQKTDPIWIADAQVYPDAASRKISVKVTLTNSSPTAIDCAIRLTDKGEGIAGVFASSKIKLPVGSTQIQVQMSLGSKAALWDEFHPALQQLTINVSGAGFTNEQQVTFGLREFSTKERQFITNGQPVFLRGKHDACVFPLTGFPPMEIDGWLKYLRICQSYGLNHIRFHSWCPPEAAFQAADQLGFYLQPELPFWGAFNQEVKEKLKPEAERILKCYGNHPSFVMFSMGNENWADPDVLASIVAELKALDPRHLYVRGSNAFSYLGHPGKGDDYLISAGVKSNPNGAFVNVRGANAGSPKDQGHIQTGPPNTMADYSVAIAGTTWPTVTHEMGQYTVYPDYKQIAKYTGVCMPYNLEHFKQNLADAGMSDQADDFARASGALAGLCYREEIESCLRTPDYGGFELLDLQDYPGQGTALVGILDTLMDSKGIFTPQQWRQFCAPVVLLARFTKYTWTTDETFKANIDLAQYGDKDINSAVLNWALKDYKGKALYAGRLPAINAPRGNLRTIGQITIPLAGISSPAALQLELSLDSTIKTSYPVWVYPPKAAAVPPPVVKITRSFDKTTQKLLAEGNRVLLVCDNSSPPIASVGGGFASDFWNFTFFHNKPGTMGIVCDPAFPALSHFPTDSHSDWQWFYLAMNSQPLILDNLLPKGEHPLVQVVDNYDRCHKIGLIFELTVGRGKLLVCNSDLLSLTGEHPEARQLLASLTSYVASDKFNPHTTVSVEALRQLFLSSISMAGCKATAASWDHGWQSYTPEQLIDGNDAKTWKADTSVAGQPWCMIEFPKLTDLHDGEILWPQAQSGYKYIVESSTDGSQWAMLSDQRTNTFHDARHRLSIKAIGVKFVRITISAMPDNRPAEINEVRFYVDNTK